MKSLDILWHSVAPWCPSGYGQQTHLFTKRLQQLGHDITVSSWFGLNDQAIEYDGIRVLPGDQKFGNVILPEYVRAIKPDLVIALMDAWVLNTDMCRDMPLAVWTPVDHQPCPPKVAEFFHLTGSTPIAMSRSGEQLLRDEGLNPLYVPHGIDTNVYKPTHRAEVRDAMRVSDSEFLVGVVASNSGGIDGRASRKSFPQMFLAFADFHANHPNAKLYLHCETTGEPGLADGLPLGHMLNTFGIPLDAVKVASRMDMKLGVSAEKMAGLYSAFDVLLNPSMGEGFGIPILEAQACGTPVITTQWTAMPELTEAGWIVGGEVWYDTRHGAGDSFFMNPNIVAISQALDHAYEAKDDAELRDRARKFALGYDADRVTEEFWKPALEALSRPREVPPLNRAARRAKGRDKVTA